MYTSEVLYWLLRSVCFMIGLEQYLGEADGLYRESVSQSVSQSVGLGQFVSL